MITTLYNLLTKYLAPLLAVAGLTFAVFSVLSAQQEAEPKPPFNPPAKSPYENVVAGAGITEARTENIGVGTAVPGLLEELHVKVGDRVHPGGSLFRIDARSLQADYKVREAMLRSAQAQLKRMQNLPRPEEIPPSELRIEEAQARVTDTLDRYRRAERLLPTAAISDEEFVRAKQAYAIAEKQLGQAKAEHALLLAGAWQEDLAVAEATVAENQAQLEQIQTEIDRLSVRAPAQPGVEEFEVLQVNVRLGEYVGTSPRDPVIVLGDIQQLHVRVDIDENDIPRFDRHAKAVAKLRGDPKIEFPLTFVRIEPYVIPKRSLTGDNTERVDTRVLQVIYALDKQDQPVYVGQQMDVFIEANK